MSFIVLCPKTKYNTDIQKAIEQIIQEVELPELSMHIIRIGWEIKLNYQFSNLQNQPYSELAFARIDTNTLISSHPQ
jgi:hypothetical protein